MRGYITPVVWTMPTADASKYSLGSITRLKSDWYGSDLSVAIMTDFMYTNIVIRDGRKLHAYLFMVVANKDETNIVDLILHKNADESYLRLGCFDIPYCSADIKKDPHMLKSFMQHELEEVSIT